MGRTATVERKTRETSISITVDLDGTGEYTVATPVPFLSHMLELFSRHSLVDLTVEATGDVEVDAHHTVEDIGLVLGSALDEALGDRKGIRRYGSFYVPMDEALCRAVVDLGGRPYLVKRMACKRERVGDMETSLFTDFFQAVVVQTRMNLHIDQMRGEEAHHAFEGVFKSFARAFRVASELDPRDHRVPSSKGTI